MAATDPIEMRRVGLCASCRHARRIVSQRGSQFWLCGRAATDPRYRKYPPLPVLGCAGHQSGQPSE
jgi:hypothetical protein